MSVPVRMCIVTREMKPKNELIRLVKQEGKILVDQTQKMQGRGVWVSKDEKVVEKLRKTHRLNSAFKCKVDEEVYDKVEELCHK